MTIKVSLYEGIKMILKNGRVLGEGQKPYIVAELNTSHKGKKDLAKKMIIEAKQCGCDAVKFQSWTADSLYSRDYYEANPMSKRIVDGLSMNNEVLLELVGFCKEIGIDFSSTPYSEEEVDFLCDQCQVPFIKIASMDINNVPFIRYIASKQMPIVLSTGMSTIEEIKDAINEIEACNNNQICILHCVSVYPVENRDVNLNNIKMLKDEFPAYEVGYSDHTIGMEAACAAIALGAGMIEKHFTLDNSKIGWDNQMATEPEMMKNLVSGCHEVFDALGSYKRNISKEEMDQRKKMRRSIVAARDLKAGDIIREEDITAKRPGNGISVDCYNRIIGRKLLNDVKSDHLIMEADIEGDCK